MDVFQEPNFAVLASNLEQINKEDENESHNQDSSLKPDSASTPPKANPPKGGPESERTSLSPSSPLSPTETPEPSTTTTTTDDSSSTHAISLTSSCSTKLVSHWALPEDCSDKAAFTMMETGSVSALSGGDCLMPQSRTCLGCFIETKDATELEPGLGLGRDYDPCPVSCPDMAMQCMSSGDGIRYGDQLLSDQLLSYPEHKVRGEEKTDEEKSAEDSDSEDATSKSIYEGLLLDKCNGEEALLANSSQDEGLLLDKCNGEEALLANSSQDWGCFESFISESKIELLDLCSKNELSVNLFSEEDVDNYMFDDEDSTLGSDVCSLKIRYESFQDNVREKTNTIQEETQFNFFPSVVAKKEGEGAVKKEAEGPQVNGEKVEVWVTGERVDKNNSSSSAEVMPNVSPESSYLFDFNNSTEDSGEYSDDSSCTGSSLDTCQTKRKYCFLSRENSSSSSQLSYGLRSKRKVRYSDDYLYDVDSIESERNTEKKEKQPVGPKKEEDDDWCPKKRRKSSRKERPVIIKYIIINRFKGEKHMLVKLGKIDTSETTVSLSKDLVHKYQRMAPLKDYWQKRRQEMQEQRRLAAGDKNRFPNGCRRSLNSSLTKRKYRIANRVRIQRIHTVELSPNHADHKQEVRAAEDQAACIDMASITTTTSDCAARLDQGSVTGKSRSLEREGKRLGNKILKIRKFKSEARLRSKNITEAQQEDGKTVIHLRKVAPLSPNQKTDIVYSKAGSPQLCDDSTVSVDPTEKSTFTPAPCSSSSTMTHPVNVNSGLPVIPGGYLQTLLDASDSSSNTGLSYYSQQQQQNPRQQFPHGLYQEENPFTNLQLAQSCVLSPPSESELQQSPSNSNQMEPNFTHISWQSGGEPLPFTPDIPPESAGFSSTMPLPMTNNLPLSGYSQVNVDGNRLLNDKAHLPEEPPGPDSTLQVSRSAEEEQVQFHRVALNTDNSRLASYDSMGSLSATSSNYSSMSHKSCEKESDEDVNDNFLAHCSPKLVIQQSTDEITPLRESTDLLDISNFTPDKFRHSSLSEMSPPDTPNLSPQVMCPEMRESLGKASEFQGETGDITLSATPDGTKWDCNVLPQHNHDGRAINNHQFQFHTFNDNDGTGLDDKIDGTDVFDEQAESIGGRTKGPKSKRKTTSKQKTKAPRAPKTEKNKAPRQNSRSSKKLKALLDAKAKAKAKGEESEGLAGLSEDWPLLVEHGGGWADGNNNNSAVDDDQREFEEPSNILSNIVSGMAEVERFMKVSIEPLWDPMSGLCQPPEANSLKTKTLKILAGTTADVRKKGGYATSPGTGRGRKATGRGAKNQAKLIPSNPFFPPLTLDCNMFNKSSLGIPGICGPAHKKMYRHKTSAKFARDENNTGKRDSSKNAALMASYEKLR